MISSAVFTKRDPSASSDSDAAKFNVIPDSEDFYRQVRERFLQQSAEYLRSTARGGKKPLC